MSEPRPPVDHGDIPPTVIVCQHGHYWRNYDDGLSMCPVSEDNLACHPAATYILDRLAARREIAERVEPMLMQIVNRTRPMDQAEGLAILAAICEEPTDD